VHIRVARRCCFKGKWQEWSLRLLRLLHTRCLAPGRLTANERPWAGGEATSLQPKGEKKGSKAFEKCDRPRLKIVRLSPAFQITVPPGLGVLCCLEGKGATGDFAMEGDDGGRGWSRLTVKRDTGRQGCRAIGKGTAAAIWSSNIGCGRETSRHHAGSYFKIVRCRWQSISRRMRLA
jgi:hypothetical protein